MTNIFHESEHEVKEIIANYLKVTNIYQWSTKALVTEISKKYQFVSRDDDSSKFLKLYKEELKVVLKEKEQEGLTNKTALERIHLFIEKVNVTIESPGIRKIFTDNFYKQELQLEVMKAKRTALNDGDPDRAQSTTKKQKTQVVLEKPRSVLDHVKAIANKNSNEVELSLKKTNSNYKAARNIQKQLKSKLQLGMTTSERSIILELARASNLGDVKKLRRELFMSDDVTPFEEYLRTSIHHLILLWESGDLEVTDHAEGWYQMHLYASVVDGIFMQDRGFRVLRTECHTATIDKLKSIGVLPDDSRPMKLDMIYRKMHGKHELFACEDKPERASSSTIRQDHSKCDTVRIRILQSQQDTIKDPDLLMEIEAITAELYGTNLTIRGSRKVGQYYVHYTKAKAIIPPTTENTSDASFFLLCMLSLKRTLSLNYMKIKTAQKARNLERLVYLSDDTSDSSPEKTDSAQNDAENMSARHRVIGNIKKAFKSIKLPDDILVRDNNELLLMLASPSNPA